MSDEKPHAVSDIDAGDTSERVGMSVLRERGLEPEELREKLLDAIGAEFTTYYYYTNLRMHLAGHEDYKEITEDARLEDRAHFELVAPRVYELGGHLPNDIRDFADRASCPDAELPVRTTTRAVSSTSPNSPPRTSSRYCSRQNGARSARGRRSAI